MPPSGTAVTGISTPGQQTSQQTTQRCTTARCSTMLELVFMSIVFGFLAGIAVPWFVYAANEEDVTETVVEVLGMLFLQGSAQILITWRLRRFLGPAVITTLGWGLSAAVAIALRTAAAVGLQPQRLGSITAQQAQPLELLQGWLLVIITLVTFVAPCLCCSRGVSYSLREESLRATALEMATDDPGLREALKTQFDADDFSCLRVPGILLRAALPCLFKGSAVPVEMEQIESKSGSPPTSPDDGLAAAVGALSELDTNEMDQGGFIVPGNRNRHHNSCHRGEACDDDDDYHDCGATPDSAMTNPVLPPSLGLYGQHVVTSNFSPAPAPPPTKRVIGLAAEAHGSPLGMSFTAPTPGSTDSLLANIPGFLPPPAALAAQNRRVSSSPEDDIGTAALQEPAGMRAFGFDSHDIAGHFTGGDGGGDRGSLGSSAGGDATSVGSEGKAEHTNGEQQALRSSPHDAEMESGGHVSHQNRMAQKRPHGIDSNPHALPAGVGVTASSSLVSPNTALDALFHGHSPEQPMRRKANAPAPPPPSTRSPAAPNRRVPSRGSQSPSTTRASMAQDRVGRPPAKGRWSAGVHPESNSSAGGGVGVEARSAFDLTSLAGESRTDGLGAESGLSRARNSIASDITDESGGSGLDSAALRNRSSSTASKTTWTVSSRLDGQRTDARGAHRSSGSGRAARTRSGRLVLPALPGDSGPPGLGNRIDSDGPQSPSNAHAMLSSRGQAESKLLVGGVKPAGSGTHPSVGQAPYDEETAASSMLPDFTAHSLPDNLRHPREADLEDEEDVPVFGGSGLMDSADSVADDGMQEGGTADDHAADSPIIRPSSAVRSVDPASSTTPVVHTLPSAHGHERSQQRQRGTSSGSFNVLGGSPQHGPSNDRRISVSSNDRRISVSSNASANKPKARARRGSFVKRLSLTVGVVDQSPDTGTIGRQSSLVDRRAVSRHRRASISRDSALLRSGSSSFHLQNDGTQQTVSVQGSSSRAGHALIGPLVRSPSSGSGMSLKSGHGSVRSNRSQDRTGMSSGTTRMQTRLARIERRSVLAMERAEGGAMVHVKAVADEDERIPPMPLSLTWICFGSAVLPLEFVVAALTGEADRNHHGQTEELAGGAAAASALVAAERQRAQASLEADAARRRDGLSSPQGVAGHLVATATTPRVSSAVAGLLGSPADSHGSPTGMITTVTGKASSKMANLIGAAVSGSSEQSSGAGSEILVRSPVTRYFVTCRRCDPCPCVTWCCIRGLEGDTLDPASPAHSCFRRRGPLCPPPFMLTMAMLVAASTTVLHASFEKYGTALLDPGSATVENIVVAWLTLLGTTLLPVAAVVWDALRRNHARRALDPGTVLMATWLLTTLPGTIGKVTRLGLRAAGDDSFERFLVMQGAVVYCSVLTWVMELAAPAICTSDHDRQPLMVAVDMLLTVFLNLVTTQELRPTSIEFVLTLLLRLSGMLILDTRLWEDIWRALNSGKWWCRYTNERLGWLAVQRADRVVFAEQLAIIASAAYLSGNVLAIAGGLLRDTGEESTAVSSGTLSDRLIAFAILLAGVLCVVPVVRSITSAKLARSRLRRAVIGVTGVMVVRERTRITSNNKRAISDRAALLASHAFASHTATRPASENTGTVASREAASRQMPRAQLHPSRHAHPDSGLESQNGEKTTGRHRTVLDRAPSTCSSGPDSNDKHDHEHEAGPHQPELLQAALRPVITVGRDLPGDAGAFLEPQPHTPCAGSDSAAVSVPSLVITPASQHGDQAGTDTDSSSASRQPASTGSGAARTFQESDHVLLRSARSPAKPPPRHRGTSSQPVAPSERRRPMADATDKKETALALGSLRKRTGDSDNTATDADAASGVGSVGVPHWRDKRRRRFSGGRLPDKHGTGDATGAIDARATTRTSHHASAIDSLVQDSAASAMTPHRSSGESLHLPLRARSALTGPRGSGLRSVTSFSSSLQPPPLPDSTALRPPEPAAEVVAAAAAAVSPASAHSTRQPGGQNRAPDLPETGGSHVEPLRTRKYRRKTCMTRCRCPTRGRMAVLCFGDNRSTGSHWMNARTEYLSAVIPYAALWGAWASLTALLQ